MNLFKDIPSLEDDTEVFETLLEDNGIKVERIISNLKTPGQWYDQDYDEWVVLISGRATLEFYDQNMQLLSEGDTLMIKAHQKHRVINTSKKALWLALHLKKKVSQ